MHFILLEHVNPSRIQLQNKHITQYHHEIECEMEITCHVMQYGCVMRIFSGFRPSNQDMCESLQDSQSNFCYFNLQDYSMFNHKCQYYLVLYGYYMLTRHVIPFDHENATMHSRFLIVVVILLYRPILHFRHLIITILNISIRLSFSKKIIANISGPNCYYDRKSKYRPIFTDIGTHIARQKIAMFFQSI